MSAPDFAIEDDLLSESSVDSAHIDERLVISPCDGRLKLTPPMHFTAEGEYVLSGQTVAVVVSGTGEEVLVRTPFTGWVMGFLIKDGQPVHAAEPILWLRPL